MEAQCITSATHYKVRPVFSAKNWVQETWEVSRSNLAVHQHWVQFRVWLILLLIISFINHGCSWLLTIHDFWKAALLISNSFMAASLLAGYMCQSQRWQNAFSTGIIDTVNYTWVLQPPSIGEFYHTSTSLSAVLEASTGKHFLLGKKPLNHPALWNNGQWITCMFTIALSLMQTYFAPVGSQVVPSHIFDLWAVVGVVSFAHIP